MRALITGASGEIGSAVALEFARNGFDIIAHFNSSFPSRLKSEIKKENVLFFPFCADFSLPEGAEKLARFALEKGGADILVNNAGVSVVDVFQSVDAKDAEKLFRVNLLSPMRLTQLLLPEMIRKNFGSIVNISSIWGLRGASCEVHYSASKGALIAFTKALADELEPTGVRVNCICPGFVETKMNAHLSDEEKAVFLAGSPLKRAVTTAEIAKKALSLAENDDLNGRIIVLE